MYGSPFIDRQVHTGMQRAALPRQRYRLAELALVYV